MRQRMIKNVSPENLDTTNFDVLSKLNFSSIFENTHDSVWAINTAYDILYTNRVFAAAFYANFGIKLKPGVNLLLSLPEPLRKEWKIRYDRALNNESFSFIDHVRHGDSSLYIEVFMNPIILEEKVVGAMFFGKDITGRKQDEQALIDSQLLLKTSLESQKDTILFSINRNYEYLYFNTAHYHVMKYAYGSEIEVGMNILDCISNSEDRLVAKENYDRALRGESHSNIRIFGDENLAYYESFFNPIYNDEHEIVGATGLARDISERRKSELALQKSEQELKELNSTKDKLFSIIAHDLRSPFNNILGFSEMLIDRMDDLTDEETTKFLRYINTSAYNTLTLLENLLNWAKTHTGQINVRIEKTVISDVIFRVLELEKSMGKAKNISLTYINDDSIVVYADENLLRIILRNLISNAIKFTEPGGEITVCVLQKNDWVEVTVADNGVGISPEKIEKLFTVASDSGTRGTANEKGSGLGLVLCKELVEKQGGEIGVESEVGEGSRFMFTLPSKNLSEV